MAKLSLDQTKELKVLLAQVKALEKTISESLKQQSESEIGKYASYKQMAMMYNDFADKVKNYVTVAAIYNVYDTENMRGLYDTTWIQQKEILESVLVSTRMLMAIMEGSLEFVDDEIDNLENFIAKKLRSVIRDVPKCEKEVQNAIENLFIGRGLDKGVDFDREAGKFNFAGREYIPDFIIDKLNLCLEVKLLKDASRKSKLIEEINADITAYGKKYNRIIFVIYDLGIIRDEVEFKRDMENSGNIKVIIIKQ